jgi:hypothetical protein
MRLFFALLAVLGWAARLQPANPPDTAVAIYGNGPNHIWDRVFDQFYVRTGWNGTQQGGDNLDPPLWPETKYLLAGPARQHALSALDEFLSVHAEQSIADPLKRAVFQHDLWAVFDWSAARYARGHAQRKDRPLQKKSPT